MNFNYGPNKVSIEDLRLANRAGSDPEFCFSWTERAGLILIVRGEHGYYCQDSQVDETEVENLNKEIGVNPAHQRAMEVGSAMSWDAPAAKAEYHEAVAV